MPDVRRAVQRVARRVRSSVRPSRPSGADEQSHRRPSRLGAVLACLAVGAVAACGTTPGPGSTGPEEAARAFLEAVGQGHAGDALALLREPPSDRALLTDAVLGEAVRQAPITQVTAAARGGGERMRTVDVSYEIGDQHVTDTYAMVLVGDRWLVDEALPSVPGFDDRPDGVAVTVSGVPVVPLEVYDPFNGRSGRLAPSTGVLTSQTDAGATAGTPVLPGRYQFGLEHPLLDVDRAEFTVTGLHAPVTLTGQGPQARLTDDGRARTVAAASQTLTACMQATTVRTCGFGFSSTSIIGTLSGSFPSFSLVENTATWSVDPGSTDLATTAPDWRRTCAQNYLRAGYAAVCATGIDIELRVTAQSTRGGTRAVSQTVVGYTADLSDPDHIHIVFWGD